MINITMWSKNRACQLDLTLNTFKKYFKNWRDAKLDIIYTANGKYQAGYDIVKKYHREFNWIKESNFRTDTINSIFNNNHTYQAFLVDDDVFVDELSVSDGEFQNFTDNPDIACVSPRLSKYVDYCYTANAPQKRPQSINDNFFIWNWRGQDFDWGYPWSVGSFHIFRKTDLIQIKKLNFKAPNSFEGAMMSNINFANKNLMICYENAKCICGTNNKVQTENGNRNDNTDSLEYLNDNFLIGKRLDENANDKKILNMCHGNLEYKWQK